LVELGTPLKNIVDNSDFCVLAASALLATNSAGLAEITELNVATNPALHHKPLGSRGNDICGAHVIDAHINLHGRVERPTKHMHTETAACGACC
jgi:hypothetical protein